MTLYKAIGQPDGTTLRVAMTAEEDAAFLAQAEIDAGNASVPETISDRQFAQQLAILGTITEEEAIAWAARGELPAAMEAAVVALPASDQFAARMMLSSATTYERSHPMTAALGAILGYSDAALDDLWRAAAAL